MGDGCAPARVASAAGDLDLAHVEHPCGVHPTALVKHPWAISIPLAEAATVASLRTVPGIEVAQTSTHLWLRGEPVPALEPLVRGLPAEGRFEWIKPSQLRPLSSRIPSVRLPDSPWLPIRDWCQVALPVAALPAPDPRPIPLKWIRGGTPRESELLETTFPALLSWASDAPKIRLDRLRFAVRSREHILVWGSPLPPIDGTHYVVQGRIASPSGWRWDPDLPSESIELWLRAGADSLILLHPDATFVRIHREQFVPMTPSALKQTALSLDTGSARLPTREGQTK